MGHIADRFWYRVRPAHLILFPLSLLFGLVAAGGVHSMRIGWLKRERLPVPVIVVGNITVGGTGKTPLVLWLAQLLDRRRVSPRHRHARLRWQRGHPGGAAHADPAQAGDEPVLLARRSRCPVWAGRAA